ncbi:hypothetical protein L1987_17488 [Smallanthus sonchifolius]|uniref:Uncharacterized protein n=1 Tax=Smallanthus sonchifolius TaxID=185202 RepID=A0ACB9IZ93_9ASTR|nr:hypothetical protein L1987_17488 [Smallanthus sonchifolius]
MTLKVTGLLLNATVELAQASSGSLLLLVQPTRLYAASDPHPQLLSSSTGRRRFVDLLMYICNSSTKSQEQVSDSFDAYDLTVIITGL